MAHFLRVLALVAGLVLGAATAFAQGAASPPGSAPERRVALVIGNDAYQSTRPLRNGVSDARAIAASLTRLGFEVEVAVNQTKRQMERAVAGFARRAQNAQVALFYYAGHGLQASGVNYLLPVDGEPQDEHDLAAEALELREILRAAEGARLRLVFLDACRDNPLANTMAARSRSTTRGLARVETLAQSTLITFAAATGTVAEDGDGANSPFTAALLQHIETPGLEVQQMLTRVTAGVLAASQGRQRPEVTAASLDIEFFLAGRPAPPPVQAALAVPAGPDPLDLALWTAASAGNSVADYQAYITQFPNGVFASLARARLDVLRAPMVPAGPAVVDLDKTVIVTRTANLRAEPRATAQTVAQLPPDTLIEATGRAEAQGAEWLRVTYQGRTAWLLASLAADIDPAEAAAWARVSDAREWGQVDAFLRAWPNGHFAARARARAAELRPAPAAAAPVEAARAREDADFAQAAQRPLRIVEALRSLGHLEPTAPAVFGPAAGRAMRQFQLFEGGEETGILTDAEATRLLALAEQLAQLIDVGPRSPGGRPTNAVVGPEARFQAAYQAETGQGARRSDGEANYWYALAIADGHTGAANNLGLRYARGSGVTRNPAAAALLWRVAAARGEGTAAFNLGTMFERGIGVGAERAVALRWYRIARDLGHRDAAAAVARLGN